MLTLLLVRDQYGSVVSLRCILTNLKTYHLLPSMQIYAINSLYNLGEKWRI